jgi:hypothetical protein
MKADENADWQSFALPGNAPDCAIGAFIGFYGQKCI